MRKFVILLTLGLSFSSIAKSFDCEHNHENLDLMIKKRAYCVSKALEKSEAALKVEHENVQVIANHKSVFIEYKQKGKWRSFLLTGAKTGFYQIKSLSLSDDSSMVYVLNEDIDGNTEIRGFKTLSSGNLKPYKLIQDKSIKDCQKLLSLKSNELGVAICHGKLVQFDLIGDSRMIVESKKPLKAFEIESSSNIHVNDIDKTKEHLIVLDKSTSKIIAFNKDDLELKSPVWEMDLQSEGVSRVPSSIEFKSGSNELEVTDDLGNKHQFKN